MVAEPSPYVQLFDGHYTSLWLSNGYSNCFSKNIRGWTVQIIGLHLLVPFKWSPESSHVRDSGNAINNADPEKPVCLQPHNNEGTLTNEALDIRERSDHLGITNSTLPGIKFDRFLQFKSSEIDGQVDLVEKNHRTNLKGFHTLKPEISQTIKESTTLQRMEQ